MIDENPNPLRDLETVCSRQGFLYFVWEREAIRVARSNGHSAPWTSDPVLAKYKFTNIRRRDDRVSRWIIDNVSENCQPEQLWFSLFIARLVNWPPTIRALLLDGVLPCSPSEFKPEEFIKTLEACKTYNSKIYGPAYIVYPGKLGYANKSEFIAYKVLQEAVDRAGKILEAEWSDSIEQFVGELSKCYGASTFMAGQVAADLTYGYSLSGAADLYTWAPMGPGSLRGLNYLRGKAPYAAWKQDDFNSELRGLLSSVRAELGIIDLTLHDMQNCMCEYGKYARAALGQGTPKTLYKPETEF